MGKNLVKSPTRTFSSLQRGIQGQAKGTDPVCQWDALGTK